MKTNCLSQGSPSVSIIIPSHNEGEWLKKTIDNLLSSTSYQPLEVIVVDDRSTDGSVSFLQEKSYSDRIPIHYLKNESSEPWGVSIGRHQGTLKASGELFIFLDAHMAFPQGWVEKIVEIFQKNPAIGLVSGTPCDLNKSSSLTATCHPGYVYTNCDISMWSPRWLKEPLPANIPFRAPFLAAAGLSLPRRVYEELGGFPSWIQGWGPEDRSLSLLAYLYGYDCYQLPFLSLGHFYKENLSKNNSALLAERQVNLALNCLKSCYLLYNEEDFERAKRRIASYTELKTFEPDEALKNLKKNIHDHSMRSYEDFVKDFEEYLPYRQVEFLDDAKNAQKIGDTSKARIFFRKAGEICHSFGKINCREMKEKASIELENTYRLPKVLAVTYSRYRPVFLRHAILSLLHQTYPVDHAIFINADSNSFQQGTDYRSLYQDLIQGPNSSSQVFLAYGVSGSQHQNFLKALDSAPWEDYDLFLKIDDDDIYKSDYVEEVVFDFLNHEWDFSGSLAESVLNGKSWNESLTFFSLGLQEEDRELGVPSMMPGTFAFSKKAIRLLKTMTPSTDPKLWEDQQWRRFLVAQPDIKTRVRDHSSYIYNIHGENVSTKWLYNKKIA